MEEQRRRPEDDDVQGDPPRGVLVPESFDGFRPARDLLDLVQGQRRPVAARIPSCQAGGIPLLLDPGAAAQGRLIRGGVDGRECRGVKHLLDQRCLAYLPRAGHDLNEPALRCESAAEDSGLWTSVRITHDVE